MNQEINISKPTLIEPGVKYYLHHTLKNCHIIREKYYNTLFNVCMFLLFAFIVLGVLTYKYKGRLTPAEIQQKNREKQQYILSKIKMLQQEKTKAHQDLITGLPQWEDEYEILHGSRTKLNI